MKSRDLRVVGLSITEDFYNYKGTFWLHGGNDSIFVDLEEFNDEMLEKIREKFGIEEEPEAIRETIMSKLVEASKLESRDVRGKI